MPLQMCTRVDRVALQILQLIRTIDMHMVLPKRTYLFALMPSGPRCKREFWVLETGSKIVGSSEKPLYANSGHSVSIYSISILNIVSGLHVNVLRMVMFPSHHCIMHLPENVSPFVRLSCPIAKHIIYLTIVGAVLAPNSAPPQK